MWGQENSYPSHLGKASSPARLEQDERSSPSDIGKALINHVSSNADDSTNSQS